MFRKAVQMALLEALGDQIKRRQWKQIYLGRSQNYSFKTTRQLKHWMSVRKQKHTVFAKQGMTPVLHAEDLWSYQKGRTGNAGVGRRDLLTRYCRNRLCLVNRKLPECSWWSICLLLKSISCRLFIYNFKDNLIYKTSSAEMWVLIYKRHLLHLWLMDCYAVGRTVKWVMNTCKLSGYWQQYAAQDNVWQSGELWLNPVTPTWKCLFYRISQVILRKLGFVETNQAQDSTSRKLL